MVFMSIPLLDLVVRLVNLLFSLANHRGAVICLDNHAAAERHGFVIGTAVDVQARPPTRIVERSVHGREWPAQVDWQAVLAALRSGAVRGQINVGLFEPGRSNSVLGKIETVSRQGA